MDDDLGVYAGIALPETGYGAPPEQGDAPGAGPGPPDYTRQAAGPAFPAAGGQPTAPALPLPYGQAHEVRRQALLSGLGEVEKMAASGELHDETAQDLIGQIMGEL